MSKVRNSQDIIKTMVIDEDDDTNEERDFLIRDNANNIFGVALISKQIHNYEHAKYLFDNIIPDKATELYKDGTIYLHDKSLMNYCVSLDMKQIALEGIPSNAKNMNKSAPTKSFFKFIRHISNAVTFLSNQVSGAIMLANFSTIVGSYVKYNEENGVHREITKEELYREIGSLIWELNVPLRNGSESPFTNITMEFDKCSPVIKDDNIIIGGEAFCQLVEVGTGTPATEEALKFGIESDTMEIKYKHLESKYINMVNEAVIYFMGKGPGKGKIFTFPLITVQVGDCFDKNNETYKYLIEESAKFGGFYAENFRTRPFIDSDFKDVNPLIKPKDPNVSKSMCCRLQIDLEVLRSIGGGIFGSSTGNTGAVSVIDLNFNRLGLESRVEIKSDDDLNVDTLRFRTDYIKLRMKNVMDVMMEAHHAKRTWIEKNKDLYPTFFAYNANLRNYFSVFGAIGMHEMLVNLGFVDGMVEDDGKVIAHELMQYMHELVNGYIKEYNVACGIEASPGENACIKLARLDKTYCRRNQIYRPFMNGVGQDVWLSSGCDVPQSYDQADRILNASEFQCYFTSGTILHNHISDSPSVTCVANYIDRVLNNSINYITYSPIVCSCMDCGEKINSSKIEICPTCGSDDIIIMSRIIGYVKEVSRKALTIDNGKISGENNFWSSPRRRDFVEREKLTSKEMV